MFGAVVVVAGFLGGSQALRVVITQVARAVRLTVAVLCCAALLQVRPWAAGSWTSGSLSS